jgi:hypothetical protein
MTYFNWENRLTQDECALATKSQENKAFELYNGWNYFGDCDSAAAEVTEFASKYPNLRFRRGYGNADSCTIDKDSEVKMIPPTHGPERRSFDVRTFHAVPNLARGCVAPYTESRLIHGQDTTRLYDRVCPNSAEVDFERFTPLTRCMRDYIDGYGSYEVDPRFGANTREMLRSKMKKCNRN